MTLWHNGDNINPALSKARNNMERYRSGHNGAVLKTVCLHGRMGSNPILSALIRKSGFDNRILAFKVRLFGEVPKRLKGHPWKGCRSLIAARGFKSLLLRSIPVGIRIKNQLKKFLTIHLQSGMINFAATENNNLEKTSQGDWK